MLKILKKIGKSYAIFLLVYWCIHGVMALVCTGWKWGESGFDNDVLVDEYEKRFRL